MTQIYRSRLILLSAAVLAAGCAKGDTSPSNEALDKDAVLEARLRSSSIATADRRGPSTPTATTCPPVSAHVVPATVAQQARADLQLQFANEAEVARDARRARDALRRAAQLDPTNAGIAYRLARASEGLRDVNAAVTEYCRYLALAPDAADSAVASDRLRALSAYAVAGQSTPARAATAPHRVARAAAARNSSQPMRANQTVAVASHGSVAGAAKTAPAAETRATPQTAGVPAAAVDDAAERPSVVSAPAAAASEGTERVSARQSPPEDVAPEQGAADQSATGQVSPEQGTPGTPGTPERPTPRPQPATERINTRSVVTGAAVGAVLGTIVGRDVKSAVIGAAAGGVLGGIAGRPWGGGQTYAGRRTGGWR
jgi:hypothetical protein